MLSKHAVIVNPNDIVLVILIVEIKVFENLKFHACLILELLLVSDDFDCDHFLSFMVHALDGLSETSLAQKFEYFVPISKMILKNNLIIALVIVVSMIKNIHLLQPLFVPLDVLR